MAELPNRAELQSQFAGKLGRLNARQRRRLERLLGHPPDVSNVPESFWREVEEEQRREMAAMMLAIFAAAARQHGASQDNAFRLGDRFSTGRSQRLAADFVARTKEQIRRSGEQWEQTLRGGRSVTREGVRQTLQQTLGVVRAEAIARQETVAARSGGIIEFSEDPSEPTITDDGDTAELTVLVWELDVVRRVESHCTFCPAIAGTGPEVWRQFAPNGPPVHFLCACGLIVKAEGTDTREPMFSDSDIRARARDSGVFGF